MGLGNLSNCHRCGKLFVKQNIDICPSCIREIEEEYDRCIKYLRENKLVSIHELSDATNVTVKQITKFIREGRISIADLPNIAYLCESCGTPIREGKLCKSCMERLNKDIRKAIEHNDEKDEQHQRTELYYQIKDRFDK